MDIIDISGRMISKAMISFSHEFLMLITLHPQLFLTNTKMPRLSEGVPWIEYLENICLLFFSKRCKFVLIEMMINQYHDVTICVDDCA